MSAASIGKLIAILGAIICFLLALVWFIGHLGQSQEAEMRMAMEQGDPTVTSFVESCVLSSEDLKSCARLCDFSFDDEAPGYQWQICRHQVRIRAKPIPTQNPSLR